MPNGTVDLQNLDFFESASRRMAASGLRQSNERAVLNALALAPGASGAHLARITGLGAQTISRILLVLETEQLIVRGEPLRGLCGQPAIPIYINPRGGYSIGCEIGWRHLSVVLCDLGGKRLGDYRRDYPFPDPASIIAEVASLVRLMLNLVPESERGRVGSLGVAMPSDFGRNLSMVGADQSLAEEWQNLNVQSELEAATKLPVFVMNDGNAACWAELVLRPRPRPDNFAYLFLGTFVGGGLVAEGRLWEGPKGNSANLGSILVSDGRGGRQIGHLVASLYALEQMLVTNGVAVPRRDPREWVWEELGPLAELWLNNTANALAEIILNTAAVSEINMAILNGTLPPGILNRLVSMTEERLKLLDSLTHDSPLIVQGTIDSMAAAVGAAYRPLYRQFFARDVENLQTGAA